MIPEDDDLATIPLPWQRRPEAPLPRIALAEVLFDRPRRVERRDVLDALATLGHPTSLLSSRAEHWAG